MIKIASFGALNEGSYSMFSECLQKEALKKTLKISLKSSVPYPNKEAIGTIERPLRGEALKDHELRENLYKAVTRDAKTLGDDFDFYCMPCMSMIGFHDSIEKQLGQPIVSLALALKNYYKDVEKLGVINMRPAQKRIEEIFGNKAVTPSKEYLKKLLCAEEKFKHNKNSESIETIMLEITETFKNQGLSHVLFARADAPMAIKALKDKISEIKINSYFDILAEDIIKKSNNN